MNPASEAGTGGAERTLSERLREVAARDPNRRAVVQDGVPLTWAELWMQSGRAAKALIARGIRPGDRIGSWSPNVRESIVVQCAALRVGATAVHLDAEWDGERACLALERAEVVCIFVRAYYEGRQYPAIVKAKRSQLARLADVVVHGRQLRFERMLSGGWVEFLEAGNAVTEDALAAREEDERARRERWPVALLFSDAKDPTGWMECSEREVLAAATDPEDASPVCLGAPLHERSGLIRGCISVLLRGAAIVLPASNASAATILGVLRDNHCTSLVLSRSVAAMLREHFERHPAERSLIARCRIVQGDDSRDGPAAAAFGSTEPAPEGDGWWSDGAPRAEDGATARASRAQSGRGAPDA